MASASVWGIDIGKSSLKAVRMRRGKDELEVQALFYEEYQVGDDGAISPSEPSRALEALVAKHPQVRKERVYVALAGHTSFSRFIKLPAFDPRKVAEMVRYEAQQQIPFPIADVNWDYSVVDREYEPDEEREVGLFAIKKELVYAFMADLQLCGIEPAGITTTPLAVYNFVNYDVDQLPEDQATVVLDIGWSTTDLVIVDGARYWIRNLALNGSELTKAIAAKMKTQFGDAETRKRNAAQDTDSRRIYQATDLVLKDFVAEIQRSIAFYKAQNKDRQIQIGQVILLGNGAKLPNVRPFFQKELQLPVETVKRLSRLTLDVDVEGDEVELLKEHLPSFGVAFGLGIQGCDEGFNEVNLLPEEVRQRQALERKKPLVAVAVAILWMTALAAFFLAGQSLEKIQKVLDDANRNLSWLTANQKKIDEAREPIEALETDVKRLAGYTLKRNLPLEVLNKLAAALPKSNAEVIAPTPAHLQVLRVDGRKISKIQSVEREIEQAQRQKNNEKTWIVDVQMKTFRDEKTGQVEAVQVSLLCARTYIKNQIGQEDELQTKTAIETGLLADIQRVFKDAAFEAPPKKIWNLDPGAQTPTGGWGAGAQAFCALPIGFTYRGDAVSVAVVGTPAEQPR